MRVSTTALAASFLLALSASCATPPPMDRVDDARDDHARSRSGARARVASYQDGTGNYTPPARGRFSLLLGGRSIDEGAFEPTDSPGVFAVEYGQIPHRGNLGFEFGLGLGFDEENGVVLPDSTIADLELRQAEFYAGMRAEFATGPVRPYIGGGATFLSTTTTIRQGFLQAEQDDSVLGGYLHGGIQADVNDVFFLGLDYRHVFAGDHDFGGSSFASDYDQVSLVLGFTL